MRQRDERDGYSTSRHGRFEGSNEDSVKSRVAIHEHLGKPDEHQR